MQTAQKKAFKQPGGFKKIGLERKLTLAFIAMALLPIFAIGYYSNSIARASINNSTRLELTDESRQTASQIDAYISAQVNSIRTEAQQPALADYLATPPGQRNGSPHETNARHILTIFTRKDPVFIRSYSLLDKEGITLLSTNEKLLGKDEGGFNFFKIPMSSGLPFVSSVLFQDEASVYVVAPVRNNQRETIGVLWVEYDPAVFQSILLSTFGNNNDTFLTLVDTNTYLRIADSGGEQYLYKSFYDFASSEVLSLQLQNQLPSGELEQMLSPSQAIVTGIAFRQKSPFFYAYVDSLGTDALLTVASLQTLPWVGLEGRSLDALMLPLENQARNTMLIGLMTLILSLVLARFVSQLITKPVINLTATAVRIANGDLNAKAESTSKDEIGILADAFNGMTQELKQTLAGLQVELVERQKLIHVLEAVTYSAEQFLKQPHWSKSINEVLERLGREFNASHAYLFENHLDPNGRTVNSLRYEWTAPGQISDLENPEFQNSPERESEFEHYYQILESGEPYVGSRSVFTETEREHFDSIGVKALLEMRIMVNGKRWGTLGFDDMVSDREWTTQEVDVLKVASNVLGAAIKRWLDEETLFEEKERAEVTLHSIGDAVITTDERANVVYLNPVAEDLIGWKINDAVGQPLENVFHVVEESSRQAVVNPVQRCLKEGRIIGLANHSILVSRDGTEYAIDDSAAPIRNHQGKTIGVVLVFHDVTEERRLSQQISYDAMHDSLTGLINRREFEKRLDRALTNVKEYGLSHILCYLDLDQFKIVNDTAGHSAGDELLRQVAKLLGGAFRQRDTFARLGGDEFGLLLENCHLEQALVIANGIMNKIREFTFHWLGQNFQIGVSIGVVSINTNTESIAQLLSQADIACYSAKDLGRDRVHVYDQSGDSETTRRYNEILQASRLRDAITKNHFRLYCQPISSLREGGAEIKRYEVLLRMMGLDGQLVLPGAFIPSAERYGLMAAIDRWVIRATLTGISRHDIRGMQFAINLSGMSLNDEGLAEYVLEQIREFSIPPEQICFEITETAAIHHIKKAQQFIQAFRGQGGKIALDDFGSGFSSFQYLKSLPVDYLKIDGSFVQDMLSNERDKIMVEAITVIAHKLGVEVVAEHASEQDLIKVLRKIGVEYAQGFGLGMPAPLEEIWKKD